MRGKEAGREGASKRERKRERDTVKEGKDCESQEDKITHIPDRDDTGSSQEVSLLACRYLCLHVQLLEHG